ncbi:MAG TPA: arsenate reductase ArsC [Ignavibacteria bacterium]|nr:arsenate reductase ArsC [Ignavibacteria bacterium]
MDKIKVLFVCMHNSARSQMAEAFLNNLAGDKYYAESAGLEPGVLNPLVVESLKETGIDISGNKTKGVDEFYNKGDTFRYVITVCDETSGEMCPAFPGNSVRLHWTFEDPSALSGTDKEKMKSIGIIRDKIKEKVLEFLRGAEEI